MEKKSRHPDDLSHYHFLLSDFPSTVSAARSAFYLSMINSSASNPRKLFSLFSSLLNSPTPPLPSPSLFMTLQLTLPRTLKISAPHLLYLLYYIPWENTFPNPLMALPASALSPLKMFTHLFPWPDSLLPSPRFLTRHHSISHHPDQLLPLFRPYSNTHVVTSISECLTDISAWTTVHRLKIILITEPLFIPLACICQSLSRTSFLTKDATQPLVQAQVISHLDYSNSPLVGLQASATK